ncbi:MAG: hypothetical protein R6V54_12515 [Desulfobacteraceae bacterium]
MAKQIGKIVDADIKGECQFCGHGYNDGKCQQPEHDRVNHAFSHIQQHKSCAQQKAYGVFADDFKPGETDPFHIAIRENLPEKNGPQQQHGCTCPAAKNKSRLDFFSEQQGKQYQGCAFHVPGQDPKLGGKVSSPLTAKNPHSAVCQRMQQIDDPDKKICNTDNHEGFGVCNVPCIPNQKKDSPGHGDGKQLSQTMEKQKIIAA